MIVSNAFMGFPRDSDANLQESATSSKLPRARLKKSRKARSASTISRRDTPEVCQKIPHPSELRGRRECRAHVAPAASRATKNKAHEHSHHGHTGNTRHSPHNGFNGFLRALPGDRACLSP